MLILKAQNVVSEGIPIVYVYQMHQQNGSFAQNVDSEDIPGSTNGVNRKARNNKLDGDRAPPTSTNVLIYKMGWPPRLQFLAPFHISCNPDINKVGNRSYMVGGNSLFFPGQISSFSTPYFPLSILSSVRLSDISTCFDNLTLKTIYYLNAYHVG